MGYTIHAPKRRLKARSGLLPDYFPEFYNIGFKSNNLSKLIIATTYNIDIFNKENQIVTNKIQESNPVGCVPPACQPYVFWWPPLIGDRILDTRY